ncbi:MAG: hypothetical protein ACXWV0_05770 [Flavisolibacter sp.]
MQKQISYKRSYLLLVLAIALVLATTAGSYFYSENKYYRKANRQLIIQNDSIISVNIELKSAVNGNTRTAASSKPRANGK